MFTTTYNLLLVFINMKIFSKFIFAAWPKTILRSSQKKTTNKNAGGKINLIYFSLNCHTVSLYL